MSGHFPERARWAIVTAFAIAMAWVEAASVFYIRALVGRIEPYQADPLPMNGTVGNVELWREAATLVMIATLGVLAGGEDNWGMTARMSIDFRKPVEVGQRIRADGWTTRSRRRLVETEGRIVDATDGTVLVTATGLYLAADEGRKRQIRERYGLPVGT